MARRVEFLALAIMSASLVGPAAAGTFSVLVASDYGAKVEDVELDAPLLHPTAAGDGSWTFAMPSTLASVRMTVSLPAPEADDAPFRMKVNVPYYWDTDGTHSVAAAIAPRQVDTLTLRNLRENGLDWLTGTLDRRVALNELTRVGWTELLSEPRRKNREDLDIALLFVISSKDLVLNNFVEPSAEMDAAVDFVDGLVRTNSPLFRTPAAMADAKVAIAAYRDAHHTQEQHIVNELSDAVGDGQLGDNCDKARSVNDFLYELSSDERATTDPSRALQVKNLATLTVCLGHDLHDESGLTAEQMAATQAYARKIAGQIRAVVPKYVEEIGSTDTRAKLATNGGLDIENLLGDSDAPDDGL